MAKKNTSVALPGGLAGLVHAAQQQPQAAPTTSERSAVESASSLQKQAQSPASHSGQYTAESYREALAGGKSRWNCFVRWAESTTVLPTSARSISTAT